MGGAEEGEATGEESGLGAGKGGVGQAGLTMRVQLYVEIAHLICGAEHVDYICPDPGPVDIRQSCKQPFELLYSGLGRRS